MGLWPDARFGCVCYVRCHRAQVKPGAKATGRQTKKQKTRNATSREECRMKALVRIAVAGAATLLAFAANAQTYPARTVTIMVPFGPGSATDTVTRVVALKLGEALKQSVVSETRPGANGAIAALYVARAAPDGYTLLMTTNSPHSAVPFMTRNPSYDAVKDFTPITRVGSFTLMLVVNSQLPIKNVSELIAYAKANPGKLSFASGNSSGIVAGETLKHWAGIDMLHVPYKSTPPALNDVLGGRVSMMFVDLTSGLPHVKAGTLRALAVTRLQRSSLFPELPTMDEAGVTGFDMDSWCGLFAPANTPPDIIATLNAPLRKIIDSNEVKSTLRNVGFEAFSSSPQEMGDFVKVQLGKWGKMIKDAGIEPE
jgi:tripartite-type tricarboxylate transporter receptor subunit TctC